MCLVFFWVLSFLSLVYIAIVANNWWLPFFDFGLTILAILVGAYGLVVESARSIMVFGIIFSAAFLMNLGIMIYELASGRTFKHPLTAFIPEGSTQIPVSVISAPSIFINAWILWVIYKYYKFLEYRDAQKPMA
jgi:hypothetical protein